MPASLARSVRLLVVTVAAVVAGLLVVGGIASAHTELDYSVPEDGSTVQSPISEITVAFSEPVTPVGNAFQVFDPDENILEPPVVTDDDTVFRLQLDPSLQPGVVGVRYEVTSDDGHVVTGSFSFTIDAPLVTDPPSTQPPQTDPAATDPPTTVVVTTVTADTDPAPTSAEIFDGTGPTFADDDTAPSSVVGSAVVPASDDADGGSNIVVIVIIAAVLLAAAGAFAMLRSRASGGR